jgi:hypothetical protein
MKKGLGALFVTSLLVTIVVSPNTGSSHGSPAPSPLAALQIADALEKRKIKPHIEAGCAATSDILCQDCSELCPAQDLLDTIGAYFGPELEREPEIKKHWGVPKEARASLRFVIATVADPAHTHLSLFFDRQIDAIQEAVQTDGYLFSRAYMPWDNKDHPEAPDVRVRLLQSDYQSGKEGFPGLMIFHGTPEDNETEIRHDLFVFVVGETPTGGINKPEFHMAVRAIQDICAGEPACKPSPAAGSLFILGPTFSGSLYSLADILKNEVKDSFSDVLIHSGSASSRETIDWFTRVSAKMQKQGVLHSAFFRTFQESSDYSVAHLLALIAGQGYRPDEVAVLSEDETAYGNAKERSYKSEPDAESSDATPCLQGDPNSCARDRSADVVHLYFPRDIAQLRSAYQRDLQEQSSAGSGKTLPRSTLQLNLEDTGNDDDSVPVYSHGQTPLSQEAVMMEIVTNLRKHRVNFIVLEATNPLDALFLIRYLRAAYSEGRIVSIDTDLLLPREVNDSSLHGVMEISSYSLIPGVGDDVARPAGATSGNHVDRVFPSNYSAGVFNALLSLLTIQDRGGSPEPPCPSPPEYPSSPADQTSPPLPCADLPRAVYAEYGWPNLGGPPQTTRNALAPPLWLTVLGRDGYWPVALLDMARSDKFPPGPSSEIHAIQGAAHLIPLRRHAPEPWTLLCCFIVGLVLIYISLLWWSSIDSPSKLTANLAPIGVPWRNRFLFVMDLVVFSTLLSLFWPWILWREKFHDTPFGLFLLAVLVGVFIVLPADLQSRGTPKLANSFRVAALALSVMAVYLFSLGNDPIVNFRLYRYVHVASGVSPLMPFLLLSAASLWWCWYTLAGLMPWDRHGIEVLPGLADLLTPQGDSADKAPSRTRLFALTLESNSTLLKSLRPTGTPARVLLPATITMSLAVVVIGVHHSVRSLEGWGYEAFYGSCMLIATFVMLCELFRLSVIWLELRRLLMAFDRLPLRRALQRVKGPTTGAVWRLGESAFEDFPPIVSREFEALIRLRNSSPHDPELNQALGETEKLRKQLGLLLQPSQQKITGTKSNAEIKTAKSRMRSAYEAARLLFSTTGVETSKLGKAMFYCLQLQLASTCAETLKYLTAVWDKETTPVFPDHDDSEQGKVAASEAAASTRFAEDFVCLFYFNFIVSVFMRMRTLVMTVAGIYVLMLLSFSCYPFEPKAAFHTLTILLFLLIFGLVGVVFAQMHRDATLSRITNTKPGELGLDFWIRLASFAAVPLFSLLTAQFPGISGLLFSWMQPALQALK